MHSLHSSLELIQSDAQMQSSESQNAVDAIALAAGLFASQQAQRYELEMLNYMEVMERKLNWLEDEAFGSVQAVAEAAGKLEYERKVEEEMRWKQYVEEVERTLGGIRLGTEHDLLLHGEKKDGLSDSTPNEQIGCNSDSVESKHLNSVLRAAISRRVEEGISSLHKYIHPYNYLKEKNDFLPSEHISEE